MRIIRCLFLGRTQHAYILAEYLNYSFVFFIFVKIVVLRKEEEELYHCVIFHPFMFIIGRRTTKSQIF